MGDIASQWFFDLEYLVEGYLSRALTYQGFR